MRGTIDRNNSQESGRVLHSIEMVEKRIFFIITDHYVLSPTTTCSIPTS